jgi:uncharacterized membrane protein
MPARGTAAPRESSHPIRAEAGYCARVSDASIPETRLRRAARMLLAVLLVGQGINHFVMTDTFVRMIPPWLPWPRLLVHLSGVAELGLGLLLSSPRTRRLAVLGIVSLFVAIFPANLHMALHPEEWPELPEAALWARLPLQGVLIAWAWWVRAR